MFLYKIFLWVYPFLAKVISPFNAKAKQWNRGQKMVWNEIESLHKNICKPIIWVHCASYGEFEQGLPIIESIKSKYPNYQIWLTFFSPSGYVHRKHDPSIDCITYLPFDSQKNATRFLDIIQPKLIIFIKYEFWYHYLLIAKERNIPSILASAIFRPDQIFFKPYGIFYKKMLSLFNAILVQDHISLQLVEPLLKQTQIRITGDTRFDRVLNTSKQLVQFDWMKRLNTDKIIIAGSTWDKDHEVLAIAANKIRDLNWIIVPHHVDESSISAVKKAFPNGITLTEFEASTISYEAPIQLIIDRIGMLRNLYQYAYISYVGGGFGKDGVHNVLEPAVFGKPVIWGKEDKKFREAVGLRNAGGGFSIQGASEFTDRLTTLLTNEVAYKNASHNAAQFILNHAGATEKTIHYIQENRLLTN